MAKQTQIVNNTEDGLPIHVTFWRPDEKRPTRVVLFLPGLKGFSNWGSFPYVCDRLCEAGYAVASIDFSRNGVTDFGSEITRIDLAEGDSMSRQVGECITVADHLSKGDFPGNQRFDRGQMILFGHSLGGAVAYVAGDQLQDINAIVTWSSISRLDLWPEDVMKEWDNTGRFNMPNARTGQDFFLGRNFLNDVKNVGSQGIISSAKGLSCPVLILQGDKDDSVSLDQANELYKAVPNDNKTLHLIEGGDHNFGAVHPYAGTTPQLEEAIDLTISWIGGVRR